ncbi:MAG: hypothetical protein FWC91_13565 [Defluviitaleaceae bacterium]|nr:hypothetical protein [Defluviitaleaceae bacterium]
MEKTDGRFLYELEAARREDRLRNTKAKLAMVFFLTLFVIVDYSILYQIMVDAGVPVFPFSPPEAIALIFNGTLQKALEHWPRYPNPGFFSDNSYTSNYLVSAQLLSVFSVLTINIPPFLLGMTYAQRTDLYRKKYELEKFKSMQQLLPFVWMVTILVKILFISINILTFFGGGELNYGIQWLIALLTGQGFTALEDLRPIFVSNPLDDIEELARAYENAPSYRPSDLFKMVIPLATSIGAVYVTFYFTPTDRTNIRKMHDNKVAKQSDLKNEKKSAEDKLSEMTNDLSATMFSNSKITQQDYNDAVASGKRDLENMKKNALSDYINGIKKKGILPYIPSDDSTE